MRAPSLPEGRASGRDVRNGVIPAFLLEFLIRYHGRLGASRNGMPVRLGDSPEATIAIDDGGTIIAWNPAAESLLGWSAAQAIGRPCHEMMHGSSPAGATLCGPQCAVIGLCRQGAAPRRFEMIARRPDGSDIRLDVTSVTIQDDRPIAVHVLTESVSRERPAMVAEEVANRLGAARSQSRAPMDSARNRIADALTPRESEVLRLLAAGSDTDEIADRLTLARNTVRNHIQNILPKIGAHSRVEAVILALQAGLVQPH
jgi:PAS domain S-box-containing protein